MSWTLPLYKEIYGTENVEDALALNIQLLAIESGQMNEDDSYIELIDYEDIENEFDHASDASSDDDSDLPIYANQPNGKYGYSTYVVEPTLSPLCRSLRAPKPNPKNAPEQVDEPVKRNKPKPKPKSTPKPRRPPSSTPLAGYSKFVPKKTLEKSVDQAVLNKISIFPSDFGESALDMFLGWQQAIPNAAKKLLPPKKVALKESELKERQAIHKILLDVVKRNEPERSRWIQEVTTNFSPEGSDIVFMGLVTM